MLYRGFQSPVEYQPGPLTSPRKKRRSREWVVTPIKTMLAYQHYYPGSEILPSADLGQAA